MEQLLVELDIHMRIDDELYPPAMTAATRPVATGQMEHRVLFDKLVALLHAPPTVPTYEDEWQSLKVTLEAHIDEAESDLIAQTTVLDINDAQLEALGDRILARMAQLRHSPVEKLDITRQRPRRVRS
jgi:hypothetical protein